MQFLRIPYINRAFSLFTGIVFLNMSFFLAEVSALHMDKDQEMIENIAKLIAGSSAEEEKDAFGGNADEDSSCHEIDLIFISYLHAPESRDLIPPVNIRTLDAGIPLFGNYEIYSPPPEA
jgi:hypothetical protein